MKNPKIGLALGSGGPRSFAHIGVIKALLEHNIKIDMIAGVSGGALAGGLYASLESIDEVEKIAKGISFKDLSKLFIDIGSLSGVIRGSKIEPFLEKLVGEKNIENLKIPFIAIATDILTGESVVIDRGSLSKAIHASSAIPGFLEHVYYQDKFLVDGGTSTAVPVKEARSMGTDFVIAVNLDTYGVKNYEKVKNKKPKLHFNSISAIKILRHNLAIEQSEKADIAIHPKVTHVSQINPLHFVNGKDVIEDGYNAAIEVMPLILKKLKKL